MYGAGEVWEGSGIHLTELGGSGFPVKEIIHGVSVQMQRRSLYADAEYLYSKGLAGEKETVWFRFPGHSVSSRLGYRFGRGGTLHFVRLNIRWSRQVNNENEIWKENYEGTTTTHVIGSDRIFGKETFVLSPEYEVTAPKGELRAGAAVSSLRRLTTLMYPYVVSQSMICAGVYAEGVLHAGRFDLKLGAAFASGKFTEKSRQVEMAEGEPGDPPARLTDYYNLQNEYMTAPRVTLAAGVRCNFPKGIYAEVGARFTHGFNIEYIAGANRWEETLKIGYTF